MLYLLIILISLLVVSVSNRREFERGRRLGWAESLNTGAYKVGYVNGKKEGISIGRQEILDEDIKRCDVSLRRLAKEIEIVTAVGRK